MSPLIGCFGVVGPAWWLDEPTASTQPPVDVAASSKRLIVLDVNGVLLKSYKEELENIWMLQHNYRPQVVNVKCWLVCAVRPNALEFLQTLKKKANLIVWSCYRKAKLMKILRACFPALMRDSFFLDILSQEDCETWLESMDEVPHVPEEMLDKPIFLKNLRTVWAKHPSFDSSNTILVDDCRYKSLKNNYENCLAIRSYLPLVLAKDFPLYLAGVILPWLLGWICDRFPTAYTRRNPTFDIEDDISNLVTEYFILKEGYSYRFDPPDL